MRVVFALLFFILCPWFSYGQSHYLEKEITANLIALEFSKTQQQLRKLTSPNAKNLSILAQIIFNNGQEKSNDSLRVLTFKKIKNNKENEILQNLVLGFYTLNNTASNSTSIDYFKSASTLAEEEEHFEYLKLSLVGILELYCSQYSPTTKKHNEYLEKFAKILCS